VVKLGIRISEVLEPKEVEEIVEDVMPHHLVLSLPDHLKLLDCYSHDVPKVSKEG
jgi:hypothetical protein